MAYELGAPLPPNKGPRTRDEPRHVCQLRFRVLKLNSHHKRIPVTPVTALNPLERNRKRPHTNGIHLFLLFISNHPYSSHSKSFEVIRRPSSFSTHSLLNCLPKISNRTDSLLILTIQLIINNFLEFSNRFYLK